MRADAARNRTRVLLAAREAFAEFGSDAQMEDIARRAGVGVGTVYRHFQTKEALIDALLTERFSQLEQRVRLTLQIEDPWQAIVRAFKDTAEMQLTDRCMAGALSERKQIFTTSAPIMRELHAIWGELLERGQREGVIREDVNVADIPNLMCALASVIGRSQHHSGWERHMGLLLDSLRAAPGMSTLPPLSE